MDIQWWEVAGLIGVTLVISAGKVFEPLRDWLKGFQNRANPLRILGDLVSCSMCSGVWVGFLVGLLVKQWPWYVALLLGGVISIASLVVDEVVGIISLYRLMKRKRNEGSMTMDELLAAQQQAMARKKQRRRDELDRARARRRGTPREMTEEEADAFADAQEDAADRLIMGEPPEAA